MPPSQPDADRNFGRRLPILYDDSFNEYIEDRAVSHRVRRSSKQVLPADPGALYAFATITVTSGRVLKIYFQRLWNKGTGNNQFVIIQANAPAAPVGRALPNGTVDVPIMSSVTAVGLVSDMLHGTFQDPVYVLEGTITWYVQDGTEGEEIGWTITGEEIEPQFTT